MENKHSASVPKSVREQAMAKATELVELLKPYMLTLTAKEKRMLPKMGAKSLAFVEKSNRYAHDNPELVPLYLNMGDFDVDFADARDLWALYLIIIQLKESITDTQMAARSEAYKHSLNFYKSTKVAASNGVSGAQSVYEELKKRFPYTKKQKKAIEE